MVIKFVLDFDDVINNDSFALVDAFNEFVNNDDLAFELMLRLKIYDNTHGILDFEEIFSKAITEGFPSINHSDFRKIYESKLKPNSQIIEFLKKFSNEDFFIYSRNSEQKIKQFLDKFNLTHYFKAVKGKQRKYLLETYSNLIHLFDLTPENTIFIGDQPLDVYLPEKLGFRTVLWNQYAIQDNLTELVRSKMKQGVVVCMIEDPETKEILVLKSKEIREWEFAKGKIESNESPIDACFREVVEETGLKLKDVKFVTTNETNSFIWHYFYAKHPKNKIKIGREHSEYQWIKKQDLMKLSPLAEEVKFLARKHILGLL